jgi:hypothetical protein
MIRVIPLNIAGESFPVLFDGERVTCPDFPSELLDYTAECGTRVSQETLVEICRHKIQNQKNQTLMYYAIPLVPGDPMLPLHPEPVSLDAALDLIKSKMLALQLQGYWRNCRGERVPLDEIGFAIKPADPEEYADEEEGEE